MSRYLVNARNRAVSTERSRFPPPCAHCAEFCSVCSPRAGRVFERAITQLIVCDDPWHHIHLLCIRALTSARAFAAATCRARHFWKMHVAAVVKFELANAAVAVLAWNRNIAWVGPVGNSSQELHWVRHWEGATQGVMCFSSHSWLSWGPCDILLSHQIKCSLLAWQAYFLQMHAHCMYLSRLAMLQHLASSVYWRASNF